MYAIDIAAKKFEGTSIVKQHRMVNEILKEEIKGMHGLQVKEKNTRYQEENSKLLINQIIAQDIFQVEKYKLYKL